MAEKRMFTQKIIDSDPFTEMPLSAQALYFHLNMNADDDGFVNNPKKITRSIGAAEDDLKLLIAKRFIIAFDNGVVTIKHWRMHNTLKKDRYKPTQYQEQFALLDVKGNSAYTEKRNGSTLEPDWNQSGTELEPQYSIEENSIDKISIEREYKTDTGSSSPTEKNYNTYGKFKNVLLTTEEFQALKTEYSDYEAKIEYLSCYMESTGKTYDSHYATIIIWATRDKQNKNGNKELVPDWIDKPKKNFFTDYDPNAEMSDWERQLLQERVQKLKEEIGTA
jgi:hypothetical protein